MMLVLRTTFAASFSALIFAAGHNGVAAAPLDQPACETLKTEQAKFASSGVEADWQKGPDWAKANASPERLKEIEQYIHVIEQLSFRCRWTPASEQAKKAGEIADKLAKNPDSDPLARPEAAAKTKDKEKAEDVAPEAKPGGKLPTVTRMKKKTKEQKAREAEKALRDRKGDSAEAGDGNGAAVVDKKAPKNDAYVPPAGAPQSVLTPPPGAEAETKLPWAEQVAPTPVVP